MVRANLIERFEDDRWMKTQRLSSVRRYTWSVFSGAHRPNLRCIPGLVPQFPHLAMIRVGREDCSPLLWEHDPGINKADSIGIRPRMVSASSRTHGHASRNSQHLYRNICEDTNLLRDVIGLSMVACAAITSPVSRKKIGVLYMEKTSWPNIGQGEPTLRDNQSATATWIPARWVRVWMISSP